MSTELFIGGLIVLTMAAVVIMALTNRKGSKAHSNDGYDKIRANKARDRDRGSR